MSTRMNTTLARVSLALCGVLLATACVRMPSAGPVTEVDNEVSTSGTTGFSFDPKPPDATGRVVAGSSPTGTPGAPPRR